MAAVEETTRLAVAETAAFAKEIELLATQKARNEELQEHKRRQEEVRLKQLAAQRARDEAEERLRKVHEETERKRKEETQVQVKLGDMSVCVAGFRWIKQVEGYRCAGGSHFVSNGELGV